MAQATTDLKTTGMHCQSCVKLIEMSLADLEGVESVSVDLGEGITHVVHDDAHASVDTIIAEIEKAGYGVDRD